jgi:HSP20 family protein
MSLIPFRTKRSFGMDPANPSSLTDFRNEMNRLLEGFFSRSSMAPGWLEASEPGRWLPAIDVAESDTAIRIRAELPGIDPKDVDVSVSEDRLVIAGEKKSETKSADNGWTHRESHYGGFSRAIPLPEAVDPDQVKAHYDKGVLTVDLTKSPTSTSRKVPVLSGS